MRTHIPFLPKQRFLEEDIGAELREQIQAAAKRFKKEPHEFSASIVLRPDPETMGHYLTAHVTYEHGHLDHSEV